MAKRSNATKEEVIQEVQDVAEMLSWRPSISEFIQYNTTGYRYLALFGNYNALLEEAGIINMPRKQKNFIPKETVELELKNIAVKYPNIVTVQTLLDKGSYGNGTYYARIGNADVLRGIINNARREAGIATMVVPNGLKNAAYKKKKKSTVKKVIARADWSKRYPVRYSATPIILKWMRRRQEAV